MKEKNLTTEEISFMWQSCKDHDHNVIKRLTEWGLLNPMLITQIPIEYEKIANKVLGIDDDEE